MLAHEVDLSHILNVPPDLTPDIAVRRWREINILLHSVTLLGEEMDSRSPLLPLLRTSSTIVQADRALLFEWDDADHDLRVSASIGDGWPAGGPPGGANVQASASLLHRKPIVVSDPPQRVLRDEMRDLGSASALSVPVMHRGAPWGALQLLRDRPFLKEEAILLWLFALVLEGALPSIVHARRHRERTGRGAGLSCLQAPAHFRRHLAWEIQRAGWIARPLTVACIEVTEPLHGRPRGATMAVTSHEIAAVVCKALRPQDPVTCMGGHHFLAAMPDTTRDEAARVVETITEGLLARTGGTLPVYDIATGLATFPEAGRYEEEIIRAACAAGRRSRAEMPRGPVSRSRLSG